MYHVTEIFEIKRSPVLWTPCGSLCSSLLKPVNKRGTRGAIRGSRTTVGLTLWRLNFKRTVLSALTTGPMLCTVLKQLARDCPLIFPGGGQGQGGFLSGMSEFGEKQGKARC